ncbi:[Fe-Fe] hydrogenase large subunit C-terminal domain-containing protein [Candidatus Latescibacterota bacterium]
MKRLINKSFVTTIKDRCRVCYTCVRECPAKAIRIVDGQAEIVGERCINCGNCVKVCSQNAKQVVSSVSHVNDLLMSGNKVAVCVAPSFPVEFKDIPPDKFIGMLKALGFTYVTEVAFGADLVAKEYKSLVSGGNGKRHIATSCPAIITYVEKYHPELVPNLAPIVSPMIAMARSLRKLHTEDIKVVFIGPCIAKKQESLSEKLEGDVDLAMTFIELRQMFEDAHITPDIIESADFDPPLAGSGALFPISRGLLQSADMTEDLIDGVIVSAEGRSNFVDAIEEFGTGDLDAELLEVLCCNGCIMGPGINSDSPRYSRRSQVSKYVREHIMLRDKAVWLGEMETFSDIDLSRTYEAKDQRIRIPSNKKIIEILARMGKFTKEDELNCGACGYESCREHAIAIFKGLAESEMCLPYTIDQLSKTNFELEDSNEQLSRTQEALMQSERMASMGQIAAGIAHEVNNPLGVVLMYSHILLDENEKNSLLCEDLSMIAEQADRCKKIVAGLLGFARQNKVVYTDINMNDLIERSLSTIIKPDNIELQNEASPENPFFEVDGDQIMQVITNLISNAYAAMPDGGICTVKTTGDENDVYVFVSDTGVGIPKDNLGKIFEPFFTTKQLGKGTGLGLSVSYGIIKMHNGDITVESNNDPTQGPTGTTFKVKLPYKGAH